MKERTPKQVLTNKMHGFSTAWRRGSDPEAYARNYDDIFRKKPEVHRQLESSPASLTPGMVNIPWMGHDPGHPDGDQTVFEEFEPLAFKVGDRVEVQHNKVLGNTRGTIINIYPRPTRAGGTLYEVALDGGGVDGLWGNQIKLVEGNGTEVKP